MYGVLENGNYTTSASKLGSHLRDEREEGIRVKPPPALGVTAPVPNGSCQEEEGQAVHLRDHPTLEKPTQLEVSSAHRFHGQGTELCQGRDVGWVLLQ